MPTHIFAYEALWVADEVQAVPQLAHVPQRAPAFTAGDAHTEAVLQRQPAHDVEGRLVVDDVEGSGHLLNCIRIRTTFQYNRRIPVSCPV